MYLTELRAVLELLLSVAGIGVTVRFLHDLPSRFGDDIGRIVLVVGVVAIACRAVYLLERAAIRRALFQKAKYAVERQLKSLVRRRAQLVRQDPYGKPLLDKWTNEIDYFISNHIEPSLTSREQDLLASQRVAIADFLALRVEAEISDRPIFRDDFDGSNSVEFEVFCAEELRRAGWSAHLTGQSHDQGADVVAEKAGMRVVVQCKLHGRPVGNKSVQETAAARAHEQAHYGIVVTNNQYTCAAEHLAATNKILLLHYRDLANLETLLRGRR
jgi:restriction system protein